MTEYDGAVKLMDQIVKQVEDIPENSPWENRQALTILIIQAAILAKEYPNLKHKLEWIRYREKITKFDTPRLE